MIYCIQSTVTFINQPGTSIDYTLQIPTFFLHSKVQGITDKEHALRIAHGIFAAIQLSPNATVELTCEEVGHLCETACFECPDCGHTVSEGAKWIAEHGNPVCPKCDDVDMVF